MRKEKLRTRSVIVRHDTLVEASQTNRMINYITFPSREMRNFFIRIDTREGKVPVDSQKPAPMIGNEDNNKVSVQKTDKQATRMESNYKERFTSRYQATQIDVHMYILLRHIVQATKLPFYHQHLDECSKKKENSRKFPLTISFLQNTILTSFPASAVSASKAQIFQDSFMDEPAGWSHFRRSYFSFTFLLSLSPKLIQHSYIKRKK